MEYIVGVLLALAILVLAAAIGFDRDRSFYPVVLVVIASYYDLFAVMGGSTQALLRELVGTAAFVALSMVGFKVNLWWVVAGLVGHGIFDFIHGGLIQDPGVPHWWPMFCLTFDVTAGAYLAWRLRQRSVVTNPSQFGQSRTG
ncbi:MAG: hypothetical protein ABI895_16835 [Deltaproteobacteria bacterium]